MDKTARLTILLYCICFISYIIAEPSHAVVINKIFGGSVDNTQEVASTVPCSVMGYSVENTLTLTGFSDARFLRVNRNVYVGDSGTGYVVGGSGDLAQIWLAAFNLDTMALIGTYEIQPAGGGAFGAYTNNGRYAGDTNGNDLFVFMFNRQLGFGGTCIAGGLCGSLLAFNGSTFIGVGNDTTTRVDQMDDARFANTSTLFLADAGAGNRRATLWSTSSLTKLGTGAPIGVNGFSLISRAMNGYNYMSIGSATTPNIYRLPVGTTVFDSSATLSFGGGRISNAIFTFGDADNFILNESTFSGGFTGLRNFASAPAMTDLGNAATYIAGDQSAAYQSTFYDSVNNKVHSVRSDAGGGLASNIIRSDSLAVIEERFACATCSVNNGQGMQMADFSTNMARLYLVNTTNPPTVNKIKVCAVGGP